MRESDKTSRKYISQMKKLSMSEKTRSDNPSSHSTKEHREDPVGIFTGRGMKSLGKKYVQDNCFKIKQKEQHHQIVISDELVRNSKLYRMLKQKIQINESIFIKQSTQLHEVKDKIVQENNQIKNNNHNKKLALWELKNQILQLKGILNDQEEQTKRLEIQLHNSQQYQEQEEEAEQEMPQQSQPHLQSEQAEMFKEKQECYPLNQQNQQLRQEEVDIRMMMQQLHKKMKVNPQNQKQQLQLQQPKNEKNEPCQEQIKKQESN